MTLFEIFQFGSMLFSGVLLLLIAWWILYGIYNFIKDWITMNFDEVRNYQAMKKKVDELTRTLRSRHDEITVLKMRAKESKHFREIWAMFDKTTHKLSPDGVVKRVAQLMNERESGEFYDREG